MKKLLVLLTAFLFFGFSTVQKPEITLKATKIQPLGGDKCSVDLELHNDTDHKITYLSTYCSDRGFYVTDNPEVKVTPKPCGKNFPTSVSIVKNRYRTANIELETLKETKVAKFRIGFKYIEIPAYVKLSEFDSTTVKSVTIWSNAMEFKLR